ncbi:conserved protein of unknown function [Candidatus Bipolaricaulis anaerobius]|uniref:HTH tetR-type domain-containing protein n=1 Tax=Candidatus Bipolaricaulis anaerobius TaxID=2026885 RepID=A0A2X3K6R7_9BACT|nr:conserved protein of unknown function [Candidatus Bipolaricaulis anaerobius]
MSYRYWAMRTNARSKDQEKSALERRLLSAAARLFAERGFHRAGIRDVAQAARVSIGTVYHYFRSKEAILECLLRGEIERRRRFLDELRARGEPLEAQIRAIMAEHFALFRERKDVARLIRREWLDPTPGLHVKTQRIYDEGAGYLAQVIEEGIAAGKIQPCDPVLTAYAMLGAVEAVALRLSASGKSAARVADQAAQELTAFLWSGLCPTT